MIDFDGARATWLRSESSERGECVRVPYLDMMSYSLSVHWERRLPTFIVVSKPPTRNVETQESSSGRRVHSPLVDVSSQVE